MTAAELANESNVQKIRAGYEVWNYRNFPEWDGLGSPPKPRERFVRGFGEQKRSYAQASAAQKSYRMPEDDGTAFDFAAN